MNKTVRNILAVIAGLLIGGLVNNGIIMISGTIIPPPEGADNTTMEGLKAAMRFFEAKHFIFPFLAHAMGTLIGAFVAAFIAVTHKFKFAMIVGFFFLIGGIIMVILLPSPTWFSILDIVGAYLPMAWLGGKFATRKL